MEEIGIDLDCEDVALVKDGDEQYYELSCSASRVHDVQKKLEDRKLTVISSEQEMRANHTVILNEDDCSKVFFILMFGKKIKIKINILTFNM